MYSRFILFFIIICLNPKIVFAEFKVLEKKIGKHEIVIYAVNTDGFPYTLDLQVNAKNVTLDKNYNQKILVSPNTTYQELVVIKANKGQYSYSFNYKYFEGNHLNASHDTEFAYTIPAGNNYKIMQGYNGKFSHNGKKAIDFEMPIGSKIFAARDGVIINFKEDSDKGCINQNCIHFANFILIYHDDGSIGAYYHLQKNGVEVLKNQKVKKGQFIGYSGNTGWSSKPHLHFEVYTESNGEQKSVATKFTTVKGVIYLSK